MSGSARGPASGALDGVRVLDLTVGTAGPLAGMLLADLGADVVKVEPPDGDPARDRPGFALWNRGKRGVVVDASTAGGTTRLGDLLAGADLCLTSDGAGPFERTPSAPAVEDARRANPGLVHLHLPAFLDAEEWLGGEESAGLLWSRTGMVLRQNSYEGGPVEPAFPFVATAHGIWAAATGVAALVERQRSGHGQRVTVGGMHAVMITSTMSLLLDPDAPELPARSGPGGPSPLYTRYRCRDGAWVFLAALTPKFQHAAIDALGLDDVLADERVAGDLEALLGPDNRGWVRRRFEEVFVQRDAESWLVALREAGVPVGPLLDRDDWLDSDPVTAVGMRAEVEDPERGRVVMPGNPIRLAATPAVADRPAPRLGEHDDLAPWPARDAPTGAAPEGRPPLEGLRVLDLGAVLAGPYAGTLLAELGADVVKVEVPEGDSWRARGMAFIRGQRGLALDLRSDGGAAAFRRLVASSDVVVDNYRSGVLRRLGIDHDRLREVRPDVVTVSITGFGEDSPWALEPAFDPLLQARSGMMTAQGGDDEPVMLTVPLNDVITAALSVLGTVAAVHHRHATGEGQRVELTLAGVSAFVQGEALVQVAGRDPAGRGGRDFPGPGALDRTYRVADGWVRVKGPPSGVERLLATGLVTGPVGDDHELTAAIGAALADVDRAGAVDRLAAAGVPAVGVRTLAELAADPVLARWEVVDRIERPAGDPLLAPGRYAHFSRSGRHDTMLAPGVGEHSTEVLREAGLSAADVVDLLASGAVRQGGPMVYQVFAAYR